VLWGPFADRVPNLRHYDPEVAGRDFGEPVEGLEVPWQKSQFVMGYDTARVANPPRTIPGLFAWARRNPGRFTYLAPPDFTGSAFLRHLLYYFGGGPAPFQRGFDERLYADTSTKVFGLLNEMKPYLWRRGRTYPVTVKEQDRLFANHEIDFAMSYNPNFVSRRIERGEYPPTARTFVFDSGAIGNYNFLAIPFNASNTEGALTVINHLLSPESALAMSEALRIPFPLRPDHLTQDQRQAAANLPRGVATLPEQELADAWLPEPDARYLVRLEEDWIMEVLER
jgi:putative spermidine/putrescine transport system substrate-binding protein